MPTWQALATLFHGTFSQERCKFRAKIGIPIGRGVRSYSFLGIRPCFGTIFAGFSFLGSDMNHIERKSNKNKVLGVPIFENENLRFSQI